jgi:ABC-type antimicrobial peptide transport system permease subunit
MIITDYLYMSVKNLSRQKLRTFLTIVAITIGSLSVILMLSLVFSIRQSLVDQLKELGAFNLITIVRDPNFSDNPQLITGGNGGPENDDGRKMDDTTVASISGILHVQSVTATLSPWIKTVRLEGAEKKMWSNILAYQPESDVIELPLIAGRALTEYDLDKIVVGSEFVQVAGFTGREKELIGKKALLSVEGGGGSAPDWGPTPIQPPLNADKEWYESQNNKVLDIPAEIVGVIGANNLGNNQNYVTLAWARKLMTQVNWEWDESARKACEQKNNSQPEMIVDESSGKKERINQQNCDGLGVQKLARRDNFSRSGYGSIILKVDNTKNLDSVAEEIRKFGYGVTTAKDMLAQINKILFIVSVVLAAIGGISLFVAAIGIINTMIMATFERTREIGVLRACGAKRSTIRRLFMIEAALLGFFGGVFGLLISLLIGFVARVMVTKFSASLGNIPLDQIGSFPLWLIGGVITFTTVVGVISGLYPAIKASRLNPVEALRYE